MSNYKFHSLMEPKQQAWGIAFRRDNGLLEWTYSCGPGHFGWTERAAKLEAFVSNNEKGDGPYVAVPMPGAFASYDIAEKYDAGPVSDERRRASTAFRAKLLRGEM